LTRIIEKRRSLHKQLANEQQQNNVLKFQVGQLQALANIGITTCMIAHEINNLLTPLANYSSLALQNPEDKPLTQKALKKTHGNCQRASKVMQSILSVANGESREKKNSRLKVLVEEIFSCLCRDFSKDSITVDIQIPEDLMVWGIPIEIQQVLMNLILNGRDSMLPQGGTLRICASESAESTQIEVFDSGCGIEPEDLQKIFEPFYTTKAEGNLSSERGGFGLGLAFCKKVIEAHNGSISVESSVGEWTSFKITIPKSQ